ncbi:MULTISPECIES: DUF3641 domain-containing protein [unclassified Mucilaginibacter]|uniref:DUF3641 domain-containing protein n=1 Tax=unclassified Mucilaginibacter TaxID=2617802 RepID=UPI002AC90460|nr:MULTISPECIES: DUF3641 domain-containing protein [unclassified Mucilaginibacter]MEB0263281.1 DUF3641 domain-containing protein [Mucilaginibacter sp. 10I4]MEB0278231.1 DUF3641 domain-containing protein [Mucilaginibacter sp. 10B2]MEB0300983.1 DUF3641 domain-containing protein [Mucilaginibacter sp. 5C4]WPX23876.1 DUF3641 domain-containing protein [Mucilaginibacter sp. 5C4]
MPEFFKLHRIEVVSSLPSFTQGRTDKQRCDGVFEDSIKALQMRNAVGYGLVDTGLTLNLVYNPAGAFLPPSQDALKKEYKFAAVNNVMCRNTISVGWDGYLYDCDFNQMLDLKITPAISQHLAAFSRF